MEEARSVLERLDRIETMRRANAGPAELLGELRVLLHEAEVWVTTEGDDASVSAMERFRNSLAQGALAHDSAKEPVAQ